MVIRVRGTIHARHDIIETLRILHLTRANHATVLPEAQPYKGMLSKVQGYVTWGEAEPETVKLLLAERAETLAGERLPKEKGNGRPPQDELGSIAKTVLSQGLFRVPGVKPLFRLNAPKGGWRSTKRSFSLGGALGYRGRSINELARRMI
jgi:large subunit ribosomal protein L30